MNSLGSAATFLMLKPTLKTPYCKDATPISLLLKKIIGRPSSIRIGQMPIPEASLLVSNVLLKLGEDNKGALVSFCLIT